MGASGETSGREAGLSERLARFLADSRWEDIPAAIRQEGKRGVLNIAGCMVAGRDDPAVRLIQKVFAGEDALLDAAAATANNYDDTHLRTVIHATPPVAGAVFSLARKRKLSGAELLHAFILGVETSCRLGNVVTPGHYERGWHITSTCGVFGAAVSAGKILRLSEKQFVSALGIAATQAAGLVEMLGSMAHVLNAGFAARNGVAAALLAEQGYQGPPKPLEGPRGFFNVFGGSQDFNALLEGLGERWELSNVMYKPYPCGVVLHALLDACLEHRQTLRAAEKIAVSLHPLAIERTNRPEPRNSFEAQLSAQHAVAVVALRGRAGLAEFSDAGAVDPEIQAFRRRVSIVADPQLDKMAARINGIEAPGAKPMDDARLEAKLRELAGARAQAWLQFVASLDTAERVSLPEV